MGALLAPVQTVTSLATQIPASVPWALPWVAVRQRFSQFHQNIGLTLLQQVDDWTKLNGVLTCLNQHYYDLESGDSSRLLIGSWGKDLATRPPRDIDVYFLLPIDWLLTNSVDQSQNRFYPSPRYADGRREEVCDGIVVSGTTAIFIECKGGFIRGDAKYGGDPAKLMTEIEKKYVAPKGVFQIAKAIVAATNRANPRPIEGVDLSRVTTIMPVLITRDDIGDGFFVNTYLNTRFQDAKRELNISKAIGPVDCAQLICMSVDVIEKLTPYLIDTRFSGILADRIMSDRDLRAPFFMKPLSSLSAKGTRPPHLLRELNAELSKVAAAFLKVEPRSERDAA